MNPEELLKQVSSTGAYKHWKNQHKNCYLSHFFCQVDAHCIPLAEWEVGFYNVDNGKIIVFLPQLGNFRVEDEVFKRENEIVEELSLDDVKISLEEAEKILRENLPILFPSEVLGNGFITLQTINQKTFWNFTFVTKTIKFVNLKVNAKTGTVDEHNVVEVIDKEK